MIPEGVLLSTVNQSISHINVQHEVERDTLAKRNEKLEEEIVKVRNVLKQAEEEIRRQDQAIQVKSTAFNTLLLLTFSGILNHLTLNVILIMSLIIKL